MSSTFLHKYIYIYINIQLHEHFEWMKGSNRGNYDMIEDQIYQVIIGKNISIILIQHKAILGN